MMHGSPMHCLTAPSTLPALYTETRVYIYIKNTYMCARGFELVYVNCIYLFDFIYITVCMYFFLIECIYLYVCIYVRTYVLLYYCSIVLLYYCIIVLLYYCIIVLLYYCIVV